MKQNLEQSIEIWKNQHGKLFKTTIDGEVFIWRRIKRKEYVDIVNSGEENTDEDIFKRQEEVVKTAILYPENIEQILEECAGYTATLSEEILLKSGFGLPSTEEL